MDQSTQLASIGKVHGLRLSAVGWYCFGCINFSVCRTEVRQCNTSNALSCLQISIFCTEDNSLFSLFFFFCMRDA